MEAVLADALKEVFHSARLKSSIKEMHRDKTPRPRGREDSVSNRGGAQQHGQELKALDRQPE